MPTGIFAGTLALFTGVSSEVSGSLPHIPDSTQRASYLGALINFDVIKVLGCTPAAVAAYAGTHDKIIHQIVGSYRCCSIGPGGKPIVAVIVQYSCFHFRKSIGENPVSYVDGTSTAIVRASFILQMFDFPLICKLCQESELRLNYRRCWHS